MGSSARCTEGAAHVLYTKLQGTCSYRMVLGWHASRWTQTALSGKRY